MNIFLETSLRQILVGKFSCISRFSIPDKQEDNIRRANNEILSAWIEIQRPI